MWAVYTGAESAGSEGFVYSTPGGRARRARIHPADLYVAGNNRDGGEAESFWDSPTFEQAR
jgi:hypothetical protein